MMERRIYLENKQTGLSVATEEALNGVASAEQRIEQLENQLAAREEALEQSLAKFLEIQQNQETLERELVTLKQSYAVLEEKLRVKEQGLSEAVTGYRKLLLETHPQVIDELIRGESITEINDSLKQAQQLVGRVRQQLEAEVSASKLPLGAPVRTMPDFSGLSAREKISYGIGGGSNLLNE